MSPLSPQSETVHTSEKKSPKDIRRIVTAALPYANGSIHLGHLVEYSLADMYVRALNSLGESTVFLCANDVHGTPIELNAKRQGVTPEALVARYHEEHKEDFAAFDIAFDQFGTTHSPTNQRLVLDIYERLKAKGLIHIRTIDAMWSEEDQRFLPDRFIIGECPKCSAQDQYGDACENCGSTYKPSDLINPRSILSGAVPVPQKVDHLFFALSNPETVSFLKDWIASGVLQPDQRNYIQTWLDKGLEDWCISRDGPYFGFEVPDQKNKFFYVWMDAPIGYIASCIEWGSKAGLSLNEAEQFWQRDEIQIEHIIGKDIVYFHSLFWPAVLKASGLQLPKQIHIHGMLTVNNEKMSKSRGTFINAKAFRKYFDPQTLRYYFASKLNDSAEDLDLSFEDFVNRVNAELVNKHANLFSRSSKFLEGKLDARLSQSLPVQMKNGIAMGDDEISSLINQSLERLSQVREAFKGRQFAKAIRLLSEVADLGNEWFQRKEPWALLKTDTEGARLVCTVALNICESLSVYLAPIVPRFAADARSLLGLSAVRICDHRPFQYVDRSLGSIRNLFEKISMKDVMKLVEDSKQASPKPEADTKKKSKASSALAEKETHTISIKDFDKVTLKVGRVISAEKLKKSKKLLKLQVDVGEEKPRQILSGIAQVYQPEILVGKRVIVVANLKPAKLMGELSEGMILAAGDGDELEILEASRSEPGCDVR